MRPLIRPLIRPLALELTGPVWAVGGGSPSNPPVNIDLPAMTGDTVQGGTLVFVPGTWTGAISYRYRVLRGDVSAPASPIDVLSLIHI